MVTYTNLCHIHHPLKAEIRKRKIKLWELRVFLKGGPSECKLSRWLNGIEEMPKSIERKIVDILENWNYA